MWVRVDDQMPNHRKFIAMPHKERDRAIGIHLRALCYCNAQHTDGFIPDGFIESLYRGAPIALLLADAGIWERAEDGWRIHDFLEYQPSAQEADERRRRLSEVRAEAGRAGADARWGRR